MKHPFFDAASPVLQLINFQLNRSPFEVFTPPRTIFGLKCFLPLECFAKLTEDGLCYLFRF